MAKAKNVEIECPECGTNNVIALPWEGACQKCNATLGSGKYSKRMMSAWGAFALGILGTLHVSDYFSADRYPINVEYAVIDVCINGSGIPLPSDLIPVKRDLCACALARTQSDFDLKAYKNKEQKQAFLSALEVNANKCAAEG